MYDFHCHLDLYDDFQSAVLSREKHKIWSLTMTTTPLAWPKNVELTKSLKYVQCALGYHPQIVKDRPNDFQLFKKYINKATYIGELGLDGSENFKSSFKQQFKIFTDALDFAFKSNTKLISLHSLRTSKIVISQLKKYRNFIKPTPIMHWFTGLEEEVQEAHDSGCYFSVNAQMLSTKRGISILKSIRKERVLTESDGPFSEGSKNNYGIDSIFEVGERLASIWKCTNSEAWLQIEKNARELGIERADQ